jgi:hypothetical protein
MQLYDKQDGEQLLKLEPTITRAQKLAFHRLVNLSSQPSPQHPANYMNHQPCPCRISHRRSIQSRSQKCPANKLFFSLALAYSLEKIR